MRLFKAEELTGEDDRATFHALLASRDGALGQTGRLLASLSAAVEHFDEIYDLLSVLADDPRAADVVVVDADGFGGLDAVRSAFGRLCPNESRAPLILITGTCREQLFSQRRNQAAVLRAPISPLSLRLALEGFQSLHLHALSDLRQA